MFLDSHSFPDASYIQIAFSSFMHICNKKNKVAILFQTIEYDCSLLGIHKADYSQCDLDTHIQELSQT